MRFLSSLILGLVAAVLVLALAVFALQNVGAVPVQFLGYRGTGNIWWLALAAAALGFVVAYLLMAPGRVAASWRIQGLSRQMQRQDEELATAHQQQTVVEAERAQSQQQYQQLQTQRDQLASERQRLIAERDQLAAERNRLLSERNQPAQLTQPVQQPVQQPTQQQVDQPVAERPAPAMVPGMAGAPYIELPAQFTSERPETLQEHEQEHEDTVVTPNPQPERIREATENASTTDAEQPSLADRVRDFFRGPSESSEPSTPNDSSDETTLPDSAIPREDHPVSPTR